MAAAHLEGCIVLECLCDIRRYRRIFFLSLVIVVFEVGGSIATGSLFLLTDAGHALFDLIPISIALFIAHRAQEEMSSQALARWERIGGIANGVLLLALVVWIGTEAVQRIKDPSSVSPWMAAFAGGAAYLNFYQHRLSRAITVNHAAHEGLVLHILSDFWQSIAVVAGGIAILITREPLIDTSLSLAVAAAFLFFGIRLIAKTLRS